MKGMFMGMHLKVYCHVKAALRGFEASTYSRYPESFMNKLPCVTVCNVLFFTF